MIITVTANPSIDRTITLDGPLERGAVQRATGDISQAGGKGVNISRAAVSAGIETVAVLPAAPDDPFVSALAADSIPALPVGPAGRVRTNVAVTESDGTTTKLNSPGAPATPALLGALTQAVTERASGADWVVLAGSLPPDAPVDWYSQLTKALHHTPARVAIDTSDAPLQAVVDALPGAAPDLIKPNDEELASFSGLDPAALQQDPRLVARAARSLVERGVGAVLATLGGAGAVLVTADGAWHAAAPPVAVASTVGAGDSSLFGYLLGCLRGLDEPGRLALSVAYGAAAVGLPGTTIPTPDQTRPGEIEVRALDAQAPDMSD